MSGSRSRKYSAEEKEQLLANLDLEVAHKTRQFEEWMADTLENFRRHQESLISRMPRIVRNVTMREFAKYHGDIQAAVKGLSRELLGAEDATIDFGTRKRKWVESQEAEDARAAKGSQEAESSRGVKNARTVAATPKKKPVPPVAPGTGHRSRLPITKTPAKSRTASRVASGAGSPSPQKGPAKPIGFPRTPSRFASPAKLSQARTGTRVPSATTFNPVLPSEPNHPRWPRKNEHMLSVNGSPLANPYQLDLNNWFKAVAEVDPDTLDSNRLGVPAAGKTLKKQRSIIIRSASGSSHLGTSDVFGGHSRSTSQASTLVSSQSTDSQADLRKGKTVADRISPSLDDPFAGPSFHALVSVQTRDGHVLEFDPLQTSPEELDALEGITDSAKQQAKEDMARLIQGAIERWKLS